MTPEKTSYLMDETFAVSAAAFLNRPGFDLAFVKSEQKIYYSRFPRSVVAPSSAVVKLLQNIFEVKQDLSFFILRNKIYTTGSFTERDHGMVKVLGKKIQFDLRGASSPWDDKAVEFIQVAQDEEIIFSTSQRKYFTSFENQNFDSLQKIEESLVNLTLSQERGPVLHDCDRGIAAVLIDSNDQPVLWALNSNRKNKSLHAEINLLQRFYEIEQRKIPRGYSIWVTHKPCKMCAGMIMNFCEAPQEIKVRHLNEVSGSLSRWTALDVGVSKNLLNT